MTWWPWVKLRFEAWLERWKKRHAPDPPQDFGRYKGERLDGLAATAGLSRAPGESDAQLRDRLVLHYTKAALR